MNDNQSLSDDSAFGEIKFFSPNSRINRLRYWAHSILIAIPFYILVSISGYLAATVSLLFWGIAVIAGIGLIAFSFIVMIQRLHDLNKSGWLALFALVPFANFYLAILLIFFAGTSGRNDYGLPAPPNKTWHWILALVGPVVAVIGIIAAVALPAYQQYTQYSQEQAEENLSIDDIEGEATDELTPDDEALEDEEVLQDEESIDEEVEEVDDSAVVEEKVEDTTISESTETPKAPQ